jgi:DNA repair exonuclease SbcCD nuclease subunit
MALIADAHLGQYWKTNPPRARKICHTFKRTLEDILSRGIRTLCNLGDTFHSANITTDLGLYILDNVMPTLQRFDTIYTITGNHDAVRGVDNVQRSLVEIILHNADTQRTRMNISSGSFVVPISTTDAQIIMIPYETHLAEAVAPYVVHAYNGTASSIVIFSHFTPTEIFPYGRIMLTDIVASIKEQLPHVNIPLIVLGDYHVPHEVTIGNTNVVSVGNMYYSSIDDVRKNASKRWFEFNPQTLSLTPHTIQLPRIHTIRNVSELDAANTDDVYHLVLDEAIDVSEYVVKDIDIYLDVADQMRATQENTSMDLLESATMINIPTAFHQYVQRSCPNPVTQQFSQHLFDHRAVITSSTQPIPMVLEMLNHSCSNS